MNRILTVGLAVITLTASLVAAVVIVPAAAAATTGSSSSSVVQHSAAGPETFSLVEQADTLEAINLLAPYVTRQSDGTVSLGAPLGVRQRVTPAGYSNVLSAKGGGRDGFERTWWGWRLYMSSDTTKALVHAIDTGSNVGGTIVGIIPDVGPILSAVVKVLGVVGSYALKYCNRGGHGVIVRGTGPALGYCESQ